ncbi:MAG TPA: replication-relaxation family protein [Actinocrinis sp.]|nr:replication-relaxation family protein [Actinocrinis sp.]
MTSSGPARRYVSGAYLDKLLDQLSERDWKIIADVWRCRVLSGDQITRLHFFNISQLTRQRTRRVVLARLVDWGILSPLSRRIGGIRGGSAGSVFSLDVAGQRLVRLHWPDAAADEQRARRPWTPGQLFVTHALAVSEVYVSLIETSREKDFIVESFAIEPFCWWPNGVGGYLKPDAYMRLSANRVTGHWWLELDRATESLPTIKRKLTAYLEFINRGQLGPRDIIPRVIVSVPDERRRLGVVEVIERLPSPADELFTVTVFDDTTGQLVALVEEPP